MAVTEACRADWLMVKPTDRRVDHHPAAAGAVLVLELNLAPGGHVPSRHRHPNQEESFTVLGKRPTVLASHPRRDSSPLIRPSAVDQTATVRPQ